MFQIFERFSIYLPIVRFRYRTLNAESRAITKIFDYNHIYHICLTVLPISGVP